MSEGLFSEADLEAAMVDPVEWRASHEGHRLTEGAFCDELEKTVIVRIVHCHDCDVSLFLSLSLVRQSK